MNNNLSSEESDIEPNIYGDIEEQKKYIKKLKAEIAKFEEARNNLETEKKERDEFVRGLQTEIEDLQRDIVYYDLNIEKATNVHTELDDLGKERKLIDKSDKGVEMGKLDLEVSKNLAKYINRVLYTKKIEFEDKLEKKKNQFQAVCVKYYKEDPTSEHYGHFNQSYSYQVFGLSNDLTFQELMDLAKDHFKINRMDDFVLTDQDHHDLVLLKKIPIVQYLTHENAAYSLFILRPKNLKMRELMATQKTGVMLVQETEKQGKIREEYNKIFDLLRKAKPGIKTYEIYHDDKKQQGSPIDSTIFNLIMLVAILVLIILSMVNFGFQPEDDREIALFDDVYLSSNGPPSYFSISTEFDEYLIEHLYDINNQGKPFTMHYIPIGVKRVIMNKMKATQCYEFGGQNICGYENGFTADNLDTTPLNDTTEGYWKYYQTVPEDQRIDIAGEASFFDGSGFIFDWPIDKNSTNANNLIENILKKGSPGNFFSDATRSLIFVSKFYEPNRRMVIERALLYEYLSSGVIKVTDRKRPFRPKPRVSTSVDVHLQIDNALLIVTIVGYTLNIILNVYKTKRVKELIAMRNLIKYVIVILVIVYYVKYYDRSDMALEDIINYPNFKSFHKFADYRITSQTCLVFALFLHSLNMIRSFVFSNTISVFLNIFSESYKEFLGFLLLFFAAFIGFGFMWWVVFGPHNSNLTNLPDTAFQIFVYFATGSTIIITDLFTLNEAWAVLLIIITGYLIFVQLDALMMSIIQENVRYLYLKAKPANPEKLPFREAIDKLLAKVNAYRLKAQGMVIQKPKSSETQETS